MRNFVTVTLILLAVSHRTAGAHAFPKKAPSLHAYLVQNYPPCTTPGATTVNGEAACVGTAEVDPSCTFGSKGLGTFVAAIKAKTSLGVTARVSGLDTGCEGKTLTAVLGVRTTSDTCPDDHCTSVDKEITAGSCVVRNGKCSINGTVAPGFPAGAGSEMTVLTCGLKNGSLLSLTCGVMIK